MKGIHGGDIYRNEVKRDFSVNINPLGVPEPVKSALQAAIEKCTEYPDIQAEELKRAVAHMLQVPQEYLLFGNGASELFMAIVHAMKPQKVLIPVPSFYGYEYAAMAAESDISYYLMDPEKEFQLDEKFNAELTEDIDLLFLANPNNPTGVLTDQEKLKALLDVCKNKKIKVVLDECFIDFVGKEYSFISNLDEYDNLIIVRAFTKIFAIPGVRLGYMVCSNKEWNRKIKRQLPEWNLSSFAQEAGCVCAKQTFFIEETVSYVKQERIYLEENLRRLGFLVFPGAANFILFSSGYPLYEKLLEKGILIRNCENFRGLSNGYFRIAVKKREDNDCLLRELAEITCYKNYRR